MQHPLLLAAGCLEEINRLRNIYRKDLPLYDIPKSKNSSKKRKFTITIDDETPPVKRPCIDKKKAKRKLSTQKELNEGNPAKRFKRNNHKIDDNCVYVGTEGEGQRTTWPDL